MPFHFTTTRDGFITPSRVPAFAIPLRNDNVCAAFRFWRTPSLPVYGSHGCRLVCRTVAAATGSVSICAVTFSLRVYRTATRGARWLGCRI